MPARDASGRFTSGGGGGGGLGTASGRIVIDGSQAKKELDATGRAVDDFRKRSESGGTKGAAALTAVGRAATVSGIAIAAGLGHAVKTAADFEKGLSAIKAVSGATAEDMEKVRAKAMQLGKDTKFSASEAASAIEELAKAGVPLPDIFNGAADAAVALAAAGEIDLPQAATIASNAMNAFGVSAAEMPKIADLIAGAANASAIDVGEFGQSLQQAGVAANLAGIGFEDTAVAIAIMGNAGIKGSDAGTSLKTMLLNLNPATKKQAELMSELGIITKEGANQFFDARGKAKGLGEISEVLQKSLKGQTKQQQLATLEILFGSDAIRAAAILAEAGASGFDKMSTSMGKVKAADVAATKMDNLTGKIETFKGSLETAEIVIGSLFLPILTKIVDQVSKVVNAFLTLSPQTQEFIGYAVAAAGGALLFGVAMAKLIGGIKTLFGVLRLLVFNPWALAIIAAIALGVWLYKLLQRSEDFRKKIDAVGKFFVRIFNDHILPAAKAFAAFVQDKVIPAIKDLAVWVRDVLWPALVKFGAFLVDTFGPTFEALGGYIRDHVIPAIKDLAAKFVELWPKIQPIVKALAIVVGALILIWLTVVGKVLPVLIQLAGPVLTALATVLGALIIVLGALATAATTSFTAIKTAVMAVYNWVKDNWPLLLGILTGPIGAAVALLLIHWDKIKDGVQGMYNKVKEVVSRIPAIFTWLLLAVLGALAGAATWLFGKGRDLVTGLWNGAKLAFGLVVAFFTALPGRVAGFLGNTGTTLVAKGSAFLVGLRNGAAAALGAVISFFSALPGRILGALGNAAGLLVGKGRELINGLINGVTSMAGAATSAVGRVPQAAVNGIGNLGGYLYQAGIDLIMGFVRGIGAAAGAAAGAVKSVVGGVVSAAKSVAGISSPSTVFAAIGKDTMLGYINGILAMQKKSIDAVVQSTVIAPVTATIAASEGSFTRSIPAPVVNASSNVDVVALAEAILRGLTGAEFAVGGDGLARIVASSLTGGVQVGGRV